MKCSLCVMLICYTVHYHIPGVLLNASMPHAR